MNVKPYILLGRVEREFLVHHVVRIVEAWRDEWLVGDHAISASVEEAGAMAEGGWKKRFRSGHYAFALALHGNWNDALTAALTGVPVAALSAEHLEVESLALGVVERAVRALATALRSDESALLELPLNDDTEENPIRVRCCLGDAGLELVFEMTPELVENLLSSKTSATRMSAGGLTARKDAIGNQQLVLHVVLGQAELTLEELRTLAPGDVVRVDRRVGEPLTVQLDQERTVAGAYLGVKGDRRAIQLINVV